MKVHFLIKKKGKNLFLCNKGKQRNQHTSNNKTKDPDKITCKQCANYIKRKTKSIKKIIMSTEAILITSGKNDKYPKLIKYYNDKTKYN